MTTGGSTDDLDLGTGADGRFTLVVFFRGLHCPVCRKQLTEIERRREDVTATHPPTPAAVNSPRRR